MWDATDIDGVYGANDLEADVKDRPCNTHVYFRIREYDPIAASEGSEPYDRRLDMTVCCRSNDIIWGAYGSNVVHFSVLQEYVAARVGVGVGTYYQFSNNYHAYQDTLDKQEVSLPMLNPYKTRYCAYMAVVNHPDSFDEELHWFMEDFPNGDARNYRNPFFRHLAGPFFTAYALWKDKRRSDALECLDPLPSKLDWKIAGYEWMQRRIGATQEARLEEQQL
jgi:hypothetical protein